MFDLGLTGTQKDAALRAMSAVARANGVFAEEERALLEAAADAIGAAADVGALGAIEPEELAAAFLDPLHRTRVVQAMMITALIDGEASRDEVAVIEQFAKALDVDEPRIRNLHHVIDGQIVRLRFDFLRRVPLPRKLVADMWNEEGLRGIWKVIRMATQSGRGEPELAWRYKQIGLLPEGTLGRAWWTHMTERKFAFPGEPGGLLEKQCHHDLTHVLTGYDTDAPGETQLACFYAGYYREDPFAMVFMVLVMFHLGVRLVPVITSPGTMQFNPRKALRALERGAGCTRDLTDGWNYWDDLPLPIDEVRRKYGIVAE